MEQSRAKVAALLLGLGMLAPSISSADPSPSAKYLMTHQPSAMDLGLHLLGIRQSRAKENIAGQAGATASVAAIARFEADANRIAVYLYVLAEAPGGLSAQSAKAICRDHLNEARVLAGFSSRTGDFVDGAANAADDFVSSYAATADRPGAIRADTLNMIYFKVLVMEASTRISCEGRLKSTEVLFTS